MPYSRPQHRTYYDPSTSPDYNAPTTAIDLSFQLARVVGAYLEDLGISYTTLAIATGSLEMVKEELHTRLIKPYSKALRAKNGDIFTVTEMKDTAAHD